MAGFKTHITVSCGVGAVYGATGCYAGLPPESCIVAGGICGIAGILPDLDSNSGVPVRETLALASAFVPALMMHRFETLGLSNERILLICATIYLCIRFGVGHLFKQFTVHRGMWHSIPAAATVGCLVLLLASGVTEVRYFKAFAATLGFLTHLVLDEIWSISFDRRGLRAKKSSGTALKFWSKNGWANIGTYAKLAAVASLAFGDSHSMRQPSGEEVTVPQVARPFVDHEPGSQPVQWR